MVLHVTACETHSFFEIEEHMLLLVMFSTTATTALPTRRDALSR